MKREGKLFFMNAAVFITITLPEKKDIDVEIY